MRCYAGTSITVAEPMPPPAHIVATPIPPQRRRSSWMSVVTMRAPVAATGWPRLQPLPFTFTMSWEKPRIRLDATAIDANASLISTSATSSVSSPARASAFGTATVGPRPVSAGATPADAHDRTVASGSSPLAAAYPSSHRTIAHDASLMPDELPAVTENPGISVQHRQRGELLERGVAPR